MSYEKSAGHACRHAWHAGRGGLGDVVVLGGRRRRRAAASVAPPCGVGCPGVGVHGLGRRNAPDIVAECPMKKALVMLVVMLGMLAAVVWVTSWFWADDVVDAAALRPWPEGLGTLAAVPDRYPPQHENEAARKLTGLAGPLAENDAVTAYVRREIAREIGRA